MSLANLNRIILIGRLTADPESRSTLEGLPMSRFRLAVDRPQGGADFIEVVAWRRLAEICSQYLKKGQLVLVEGWIHIHSFEDQTGQRHWTTEVVCRGMQRMGRGAEDQSIRESEGQEGEKVLSVSEDSEEAVDDSGLENDLPF